MKPTLKPGLTHRFAYKVPENKTVPYTYPESPEIAAMPKVFATGFMIVLMEWTCMQLLAPHLDPGEGSLGVHVDVSHLAATPPGMTVTVDAECTEVDGQRVELQGQGPRRHRPDRRGPSRALRRQWDKFNAQVAERRQSGAGGRLMAEAARNAISPSISGRSIRRRTACCAWCSSSTARSSSASIRISGCCIAAPRS